MVVKLGGGADKFGVAGGGTDMFGKLMVGGGFANCVVADITKEFIGFYNFKRTKGNII